MAAKKSKTRLEKDSLGIKPVPGDAYFGIETDRKSVV